MATSFDFSGKVVLITGVARRGQIGYALARAFGRNGARLVAADRDAVAVAERAREFEADGLEVRPAAGDLTEPDMAALAVETAVKHFGGLDVLVNVAGGLTTFGPLAQSTAEDLERELAINLRTAYLMSRAALDSLAARRGAIVNFASVAVYRPDANLAIYSAAKNAVAGFTRSLAVELHPRIRVNAVAPGMVRTAENVASAGEQVAYVEMEDIVRAVLFLASDAAAGINGHVLPVTAAPV